VGRRNVQYNGIEEKKLMAKKNRKYTEEFKREALEMASKPDVKIAQTAKQAVFNRFNSSYLSKPDC
jgi:transposase-like protein